MKYLCIQDYTFIGGEIAFKKGNIYHFNKKLRTKRNEEGVPHSLYDRYTFNNHFKSLEGKKDLVVLQVVNKFKERSKLGIKKYGTTLEENNTDDFYNHLQEELMDAILYLQKLRNDKVRKN